MTYVELSRHFMPLQPSDLEEEQSRAALWMFGQRDGGLSWEAILADPYVVVLGEAGIGKTAEFENQSDRQRQQGSQSFFIRVEQIAGGSLDSALDLADRTPLRDWADGNDEATFFLDAVDDAKLINQDALTQALRTLQNNFPQQWDRVRLVISCRVSDWKPTSDSNDLTRFCTRQIDVKRLGTSLERFIGAQSEQMEEKAPYRAYRMLPLSTGQVRVLAEHYQVNDLTRFMEALEDTDLVRLAGRPRDLQRLVSYWNEYNRFGTYKEMLEYSITTRLEEHHEHVGERRPLALEQARRGAERIAAAMSLCQTSHVRIPDSSIGQFGKENPALELVDLLADFDQAQQTALLARPIFDSPTYGRVRFHDRDVLEYLAASWLAKCLSRGADLHRLLDLFTPTIYRRSVCPLRLRPISAVNPTLRGALPWFAANSPHVSSVVTQLEPELLLLRGDPQQLPLKTRKRAFRAFCKRYENRRWAGWSPSRAELKKLSSPDVVDEVMRLLKNYRKSDAARILLLDVIQAGKFETAQHNVLRIAVDPSESEHIRCVAIDALREIGTPDSRKAVANILKDVPAPSNEIKAAVIPCTYPDLITTQCVLELIKHSAREIWNRSTMLPRTVEEHVVSHCPPDDLDFLLEGLVELYSGTQSLTGSGKEEESAHFWWIPRVLASALLRASSETPTHDVPSEAVLSTCELVIDRLAAGDHHLPDTSEFAEQLREHPSLKRALLLRDSERATYQIHRARYWTHTLPTHPTVDDADWMLGQVDASNTPQKREFWFHLLLFLWRDSERPQPLKDQILSTVTKHIELQSLADQWFNPSPSPISKHEERWKREKERREREEAKTLANNRRDLSDAISDIRAGTNINALRHLVGAAAHSEGSSRSKIGTVEPEELAPTYGADLANATRAGLKAAWRRLNSPPQPGTGRIPSDDYMALVGIRLDVEDGLDFASLSDAEAGLAARFALRELNGFPVWIDALANKKREGVLRVFREQIQAELRSGASTNFHPPLLSSLVHSSNLLVSACAPLIFDLLEADLEPNRESLRYGLDVVMLAGDSFKGRLARISELRVHQFTASDEHNYLVLWIRSWIYAEPEPAWGWIESILSAENAKAMGLAVQLGAALNGGHFRRSFLEDSWNVPVRVLRRMIPVFVRLVNPKDDVWHEGVHSPTTRDEAAEFRNSLFQKLARIPGYASDKALRALTKDACLRDQREHIARLIEEHRQNEARSVAWTPAQVVDFEQNPRSATVWTRLAQRVQSRPLPVLLGYGAGLLASILALGSALFGISYLLSRLEELMEFVRAVWPF